MKALEQKNNFSFPSFASTAFILKIFENEQNVCNLHVNTIAILQVKIDLKMSELRKIAKN